MKQDSYFFPWRTEMIFPAQVTIVTQHFSHIKKYRLEEQVDISIAK